jgi:predicted lipoprotein with Yx(FWY)xxD motif
MERVAIATLTAVALQFAVIGTAMAQVRVQTPQISCQAANGLVDASGAAVLGTGVYTYDRYVRSQSACAAGQITRPAWVPAADQAQCFIGYTCIEKERRNNRN